MHAPSSGSEPVVFSRRESVEDRFRCVAAALELYALQAAAKHKLHALAELTLVELVAVIYLKRLSNTSYSCMRSSLNIVGLSYFLTSGSSSLAQRNAIK